MRMAGTLPFAAFLDLRHREIECPRRARVVHANQRRGRACLLKRLCDDDGQRLVVVLHIRPTQQHGGVVLAFGELARLFGARVLSCRQAV